MNLQKRIGQWVNDTLGEEGKTAGLDPLENVPERALRFLEEAVEVVQTLGVSREQAHRLVDYVMDRPVGFVQQEIGGAMLTLYAVAESCCVDADAQCLLEVARVETPEVREKVRRRQAEKREALVVA